jgi:exonuclease V gamma subunit
MSVVHHATDLEPLAERLSESLDEQARSGDFFVPGAIVVPNRLVARWLRLWLARKQEVAINLRFLRLEQAIWEMLRLIDPRRHTQPLELADHDSYRLMVLSVLQNTDNDALEPLTEYWLHNVVRRSASQATRSVAPQWRRLWHLTDRLAGLVRDYEYHRQEWIQRWIHGGLNFGEGHLADIETAQREIFLEIIREPDGKRARLGHAAGKLYKTLPQYAQELMLDVPSLPPHPLPLSPQGRGGGIPDPSTSSASRTSRRCTGRASTGWRTSWTSGCTT